MHVIQNTQNYDHRRTTTHTGEDELSLVFLTMLQCHLNSAAFIKANFVFSYILIIKVRAYP